jgi:restriction system protein
MSAPTYDELFNPLISVLHELGGSGTVREIEAAVIKNMKLSEKDVAEIHRDNQTKLSYRLAWARTYLKRYGLLENSEKGVWRLTQKGIETKSVNSAEVNSAMRQLKENTLPDESDESETWKQELLGKIRKMSPSAFEFLAQRLLREAGFEKVEVTGRSGDGGIDGKGIMRLGALLSFNVVFQCKRYIGSVPTKEIRDFRGAMSGRSEKGLFITTGRFTPDALAEAQREGATPIDLIDGDQLADLMLSLKVGVTMQEAVDEEWFKHFKPED